MADQVGVTESELRFAVLAEKRGYAPPLCLHGLTMTALYDDIVVPYEEGEPFFIDGVPVHKKDLDKLKIVRQDQNFARELRRLHNRIRNPTDSRLYTPIADYPGRLAALFQMGNADVTSNIINPYREKKKLNLSADKIVAAASEIAIAAIKASTG